MNILLISLAGLGNLITQLPLLEGLAAQYPQAKIDLLVRKGRGGRELMAGHHLLQEIYEWPAEDGRTALQKLRTLWQATRQLPRYDMAVTGFPNLGFYSAVLMRLVAHSALQHCYHFGPFQECSFLLTQSPRVKMAHLMQTNLSLLADFDPVPQKTSQPHLSLPQKAIRVANVYLAAAGLTGRTLIGIHPGCFGDMTYKRWDSKNWLQLAGMLKQLSPTPHLLVFGTDGDGLEVFAGIEETSLVQRQPIPEVAALIAQTRVFISGDSGLSHLAGALHVPQVVLFGATDHRISAPCSPEAKIITPPEYRPFYLPGKGLTAPVNNSINTIRPDVVFDAVRRIYSRQGG